MVFLARYRFMRVLPVDGCCTGFWSAYACLIGYEIWHAARLRSSRAHLVILPGRRHIPYCAALG